MGLGSLRGLTDKSANSPKKHVRPHSRMSFKSEPFLPHSNTAVPRDERPHGPGASPGPTSNAHPCGNALRRPAGEVAKSA